MPEHSRCRSCGAAVILVHSATTGALMILDYEPNPEKGNVAIIDGKAQTIKKGDLFEPMIDKPLYLDHHASCPKAQEWRKKKAKKD